MTKNFYTVKEYAKITGLSENTVYRRLRKGKIDTLQKAKGDKHSIPTLAIPTFIRDEMERK